MATEKRTGTSKGRTTKPKKTSAKTTTSKSNKGPEVAKVRTQAIDIDVAIRIRAYELYEERGGEHGFDIDDWLRAESEVRAHFGIQAA